MRREFTLYKRDNGVWYFMHWEGNRRRHRSTGERAKVRAEKAAREYLARLTTPGANITLRTYSETFFTDDCPRGRRRAEEGKPVTLRHRDNQRYWLSAYVWTDPLAEMPLADINSGHVLDFRSRLRQRAGASTINHVMAMFKVVIKEACFRGDLDKDPTYGVGQIAEGREEAGIFTEAELRLLFPAEPPGPWGDLPGYVAAALAAFAGMRRAEALALKWCNVDLGAGTLHVVEAWKDARQTILGPPKWNITRETPMGEFLVSALLLLKDESVRGGPDDFVLAYEDTGRPHGYTWWRKRFDNAIKNAGIRPGKRRLSPHSFRHTIWTLAVARGLPPELTRAAFGWTNDRTPRGYTHLKAEHGAALAAMADSLVKVE